MFIDQVIEVTSRRLIVPSRHRRDSCDRPRCSAQVSEPLGAPELLTTLIANNLDLTISWSIKGCSINSLALVGVSSPATRLGANTSGYVILPRESDTRSAGNGRVDAIYQRTSRVVPGGRPQTAVVKGDTAFRACEWPCAKVDDPPDGFLGEELERAARPFV